MNTTTQKHTKTEEKIYSLLTENTGRALCDSGDYYGRHYEANQKRTIEDFLAEPYGTLEVSKHGIEVTVSVFQFLRESVTFCKELDEEFRQFCERPENEDESWLENVEGFVAEVREDDTERYSVNTYNGEDLLSQTLQYTVFEHPEHGQCALLQVHNGCDARGGYTQPAAFTLNDDYSLAGNARATLSSTDDRHKDQLKLFGERGEVEGVRTVLWATDDTCHWYQDGSCGYGAKPQLETYELSDNPDHKGDGTHLYYDEDGNGYCPITGQKLEVGP